VFAIFGMMELQCSVSYGISTMDKINNLRRIYTQRLLKEHFQCVHVHMMRV
jgi:hypothetical protein